jgi:outer membrane protein OmpA-like peptidoglycan-associated protein
MRKAPRAPYLLNLVGGPIIFMVLTTGAGAQTAAATPDMVHQLGGLQAAADVDVAVLRQQALDRIKSRADSEPLKRPPVAAELPGLPQIAFDVQFDPDSAIIRPGSYRTLGRIADALSDPALLQYSFLIVGHTGVTGRRESNLTLSQRRADSIRDALVTTFKISPKRLRAVGLGEEQLLDAAHPAAAINQQIQIVTVGQLD